MTRETVEAMLARERSTPRRDTQVVIRFSAEERERLLTTAQRQGVPAATLARVLILAGLDDLEGGKSSR